MTRTRLLWMAVVVAIAVVVAWQVIGSSGERAQFVAQADIPTVAPGVDVLAGIAELPVRIRGYDYHRDAFGDSWTDDNPAPGGHNGCDTRNDILDRDQVRWIVGEPQPHVVGPVAGAEVPRQRQRHNVVDLHRRADLIAAHERHGVVGVRVVQRAAGNGVGTPLD